jgi:hypothetical protein
MRIPRVSRSLLAVLSVSIALWAPRLMAIEEPRYEVIGTYPAFELREYAPYLVAEVDVSGDFDEVGSSAFRILADYIFGNNRPGEKMAMTAPVNQRPASSANTRLEMAAPVSQQPAIGDGGYVVSFVMPSGYTLEGLPVPNDARVRLRAVPARLVAARRYSGRWSETNYRQHETALLEALHEAGLQPLAAPVYARYNSPFSLWFLRRNEVLVDVASGDLPGQ